MKHPARMLALGAGFKRYNTGEPCIHGHMADRFASSGGCVVCAVPKDRQKTREYHTKWQRENTEKYQVYTKRFRLRDQYNLSLEEYEGMVSAQNGRCLICQETHKLVVDHDHKTGKVRGLLCDRCNHGLGHFKDDEDNLARAIEYLKINVA